MQNIDLVLDRESETIRSFFNLKSFNVAPLPDWIGDEMVKYWDSLLFDIHYLPKISLDKQLISPLWLDRPNKYFYRNIDEGTLRAESKELPGKWILVDARNKPPQKRPWINCNDVRFFQILGFNPKNYLKKKGKQQFESEYLEEILKQKGFGSRFCLSISEINELKPFILEILKLDEHKKIRLPYFIEYNYLGNAFYKQWATTETWEWFEDTFGNEHHVAGGSGSVGCMGWDPPEFWSTILTFRPVIEL